MTVQELIVQLSALSPDLKVGAYDREINDCYEINQVAVERGYPTFDGWTTKRSTKARVTRTQEFVELSKGD